MPKAILKPAHEIALILATRPMRTGKQLNAVQARVLRNLEAQMMIADLIESELAK